MMNTAQKALVGAAIVGSVIAGGAFGAAITGAATAATDTPSDSSTTAPSAGSTDQDGRHGGDFDPSTGGHVGENGVAEELLTGDTATQVTDAVKAEYPDATIERVETDAEGAAYEAHIVQADGTHATVKLDETFTITGTETGRPGGK
jgi:hypothetical protein